MGGAYAPRPRGITYQQARLHYILTAIPLISSPFLHLGPDPIQQKTAAVPRETHSLQGSPTGLLL